MINDWAGKKVLVMGLGLHGGGYQVAKWLLKKKVRLTITDQKTTQQLKPTLDKLKKLSGYKNIKFTLGKHNASDFVNQDLLIQNPGVPAESKYLTQARKNNIPIVNEAVMFFGLYNGKTIGITGTRGKSTITTLLHQILKTKIKHNVAAGNIATTPMFAVIDKLPKNSWPVIELSSWHLENLAEYKISPNIAVITNILKDHLNRYPNFPSYVKAKYAIVANQKKSDLAVLNYDNILTRRAAKLTKAKVYYFSSARKVNGSYLKNNKIYFADKFVMTTDKIKLLGQHNLANILAAVTVAKLLKINNKAIAKAVNKFSGIPYRLQLIRNLLGAKIYNDATSTTPDATEAAIKALAPQKILLIAGGEDKQLNYNQLAKVIKKQVNQVILLAGSGSVKLIKALRKVNYPRNKLTMQVKSLPLAWDLARKNVKDFDCVLFSPAAASFNMFVNEFARAKFFDKLVKK